MSSESTPAGSEVHHVVLESDICTIDSENPLSFAGRGHKRFRSGSGDDDEERSDYEILKEELSSMLICMLLNWKMEQDVFLNKLGNDLSELKQQNAGIKSTSDEMEKSLKFISLQYEEMKQKLCDMERERKDHMNYISTLENKIDDLQKRSKHTVIEFKNLPPPLEKIKPESQQDLCELVKKTCSSVNTQIQSSEVKDIYRVKTKTSMSTVVTELTSVLTKNKILNGVKEFNKLNPFNRLSSATIGHPGPKTTIYVTESLTSKDRKLYAMTRDKAKSLGYKYCWTNNGRIFIKGSDGGTRIQIKDEADLSTLKRII